MWDKNRTEGRQTNSHHSWRLNKLFSLTDRTISQKISKDIRFKNTTINYFNRIDIYRRPQLTMEEYTFFSSTHVT